MPEHEEIEGSVAAWVLGALDAGEADVVRAHVEGCPICSETAERLGRLVGVLPLEAEEIAPPAGLRERILAAAAGTRDATTAPDRSRARVSEEPPRQRTESIPRIPRAMMPIYAAAAAVLLALVVGVAAGDVIGRGAPAPTQVVRSALVGHQALAGAKASVIDLRSDGVVLVDFSGLPQLDSGKVYEVWLITAGGRADPAGVFVPDTNGSKFVLVGKSLAGYAQMAITSEVGPAGTQAPTQQPQLYGTLA
jgi:hypothetical protein